MNYGFSQTIIFFIRIHIKIGILIHECSPYDCFSPVEPCIHGVMMTIGVTPFCMQTVGIILHLKTNSVSEKIEAVYSEVRTNDERNKVENWLRIMEKLMENLYVLSVVVLILIPTILTVVNQSLKNNASDIATHVQLLPYILCINFVLFVFLWIISMPFLFHIIFLALVQRVRVQHFISQLRSKKFSRQN